jgi:hypothetical protein
MKIKKESFVNIVKQALVQLIAEGAFNDLIVEAVRSGYVMPSGNDPRLNGRPQQQRSEFGMAAARAARTMAKGNQAQARILEDVFAGVEETAAKQKGGELETYLPEDQYSYQEQYQYGNYNQQYAQQQQYPQQDYGQPIPPQQSYGGGYPTKWAEMAFKTPIKNRPSDESGGGFGFGGGGGHYLPGITKNRNG